MYLKPNVVLEPLYQQWYAWPHLISPATAAMNVLNRHVRIMDSYLQSPTMHERFARDPKMLGSPFMRAGANRIEDVRILRDKTKRDHGQVIDFANAIVELNTLLKDHAVGYSLDELYARVPAPLKGYVEIFYDLDNHPSFRFLEALLYHSPYYDVSSQSVALYLIKEDERAFVLSTPRFANDDVLHLSIPFAHAGIDALFQMRTKPGSYCLTRDLLEIPADQETLFRSLFTEEAPLPSPQFRPDEIQIRYFGHACVLVMFDGISVLTDPSVSYDYETDVPRHTYSDLPDQIDYVLLTHNHQDHVLFETLLQLRHKIGQIIVPCNGGGSLQDPSMKLMFKALGFRNVVALEDLESRQLTHCMITGIPFMGEHADLNIRSKLGYHLALSNGLRVLFAADSCCFEPQLYQHVHEVVGDADILFVGMECDGAPLSWLYGPLLQSHLPPDMDQSRRLNASDCKRAMGLVNQFNPAEVYVYAMGQEPWLKHIMALEYTAESRPIVASDGLIEECHKQGILAKRLFGREVIRGDC